MFRRLHESAPIERKTFWACLSGWAMRALDVQLFSLVPLILSASWRLGRVKVGLIGSVPRLTSASGRWMGGALSVRIGRDRALQVFFACLAQTNSLVEVTGLTHRLRTAW